MLTEVTCSNLEYNWKKQIAFLGTCLVFVNNIYELVYDLQLSE